MSSIVHNASSGEAVLEVSREAQMRIYDSLPLRWRKLVNELPAPQELSILKRYLDELGEEEGFIEVVRQFKLKLSRMEPDTVKDDTVNHPSHYTAHPSGIEAIEICRHMNFNLGNAMKYLWRAGKKSNELEDLKKARWYLDDEIKKLESEKGIGV